jgi:hypothetical protein
MNRWIGMCIVVSLLAFAAGCKKKVSDQDAVRAAIENRLSERLHLNMSAMTHKVKSLSIRGDQAVAQVEFSLKNGGPSMQVEYGLERQNGKWTVVSSQPMGSGQFNHPMADPDATGP